MNNLLTQKFPIAAFVLLFVLTLSCSEEPETTEKPMPNVVNWNDSTINGDALMCMKFSVGWGGMTVSRNDVFTRTTTDIDGSVTFSENDLIAIAVTKTGGSEIVKPYRVKSDGSLVYAGTDNDPFVWKSTSETATIRAWSYGSDADLAYLTTAPETRDYSLEADQETNGYLELLYSKTQSTSYAASPISLSFYHQLSRIIFNVKQELSGTLPVSSVSIGNTAFPLVASFSLPTGDSNYGTWTTDGSTFGTLTPKEETAQTGYDHTYSAVIFPGTYAKDSKLFTLTNTDGDYIYTISDAAGQTLTTSNQYAYTISVKNKLIYKNPLWWVAQYNMASDKASFVAAHSTSSQYVFNWTSATTGVNVPDYHVPTQSEMVSIVPTDEAAGSTTDLFALSGDFATPTEFSEIACIVGGNNVNASTSLFAKVGSSELYAIRFIGTEHASAWHYKIVSSPCVGLLIESYLIKVPDLTTAKSTLASWASELPTIFTGTYENAGANLSPANTTMTTNGFVQRFFPACGARYNNNKGGNGIVDYYPGQIGRCWTTDYYGSYGVVLAFSNISGGDLRLLTTGLPKYGYSVRLFKDSFTRKTASGLTIDDISACTYDGTEQEPTPDVYDGSTKLTKDVDYQLSYTNNINAGIATLTLKGIGAFTGTATKAFTINKAASTMTNNDGAVSFTASQNTNSTISRTITCTNCSVSGASVTSGSGFSITRDDNTITVTRTSAAAISGGVITVTGTPIDVTNYSNPSNITINVSGTLYDSGVALANASVGYKVCSNGKAYDTSATLPSGVSVIGMVAYKDGSSGIVMYKQDNSGTYAWANRDTGNPSAVNVYVSDLSSKTSKSWVCGTKDQYLLCSSNPNFGTLLSRLNSAGCSQFDTSYRYWTSNEASITGTAVYFQNGTLGSSGKVTLFKVRAIFAF